jgi:hypothetical protein
MKSRKQDWLMVIIIVLQVIILASINLTGTGRPPSSSNDDKPHAQAVAILEARSDSIKKQAELRQLAIESEYQTRISNQRKYYENKIARIYALPADSSLWFFSAYTGGGRGHRGSGSD